ncbi:FG-GAP-like repeat-containing protein [Streptomyces flavidovirens]|uniref:FG-GAP-like repeat-containing protein n=1 Tax=Streptomyces flavidovirens TaxID=67298 RepID=UPI0036CC0787
MFVRRAAAFALSAALGVTGLTASAATAVAAPTGGSDVVIDAPPSSVPATEHLYGAGSGVQTYDFTERKLRWQSLADGRVAHLPACDSTDRILFSGDLAGCPGYHADAPEFVLHDYRTGSTERRAKPEGHTWLRAFSSTRLLSSAPAASGAEDGVSLHLLGIGTGAPADVQVELPGKVTGVPEVLAYDSTGALIRYYDGSAKRVGLVDFTGAKLVPVAGMPAEPAYLKAAINADWIIQYNESGTTEAFVISRKDISAPARTVKLPNPYHSYTGRLAVVGDWVVGHYGYSGDNLHGALKASPLDGGPTRDLVARTATADVVTGSDGAAYAVGGTDSTHWGVQRVALDENGVPAVEEVLRTPPQPVTRTGVTLSHGRAAVSQADDGSGRTIQGYDVTLTDPPTVSSSPAWSCQVTGVGPLCREPDQGSLMEADKWPADTGDGRLVSLAVADGPSCYSCATLAHVKEAAPDGAMRTVRLESTRKIKPIRILVAAGRYVQYLATENYMVRSVVADIDTGKVLRVSDNPNESLWGDRIWASNKDTDTVSAIDLRSGTVTETVDLGTDCNIYSLQVVGKWIYSSCPYGTSAFVYDREKKSKVEVRGVRSGQPQLGDGFVAYNNDTLQVADVRSGSAVVTGIGTVASGLPNHGQGWAVDRFGASVAYVDEKQAVHVVGLGGITSPLSLTDSQAPAAVALSGPASWQPRWRLSKPAASWSLTLTHKATGAVVRTLTGGEARGLIAGVWDGKNAKGKLVANGAYTWALRAKPADGHGADLTATGAVSVSGAAPVRRDLAGDDGFGDLLVMDSTGLVSLYKGTGKGGVSSRLAGTGAKFATTAVLVPSGDVNGDRCNDVLVRLGNELRSYRPGCGKVVSASSPYTSIGTGWSQYGVLTSPGDVNGDGHPDLIARQTTTGDMYFYAGTADHRFKGRVKIGTNWKGYTKIVGAGDLNGDGRGDLLGVDTAGALWRYYGTATGGVTSRVKLAAGWGSTYTTVVGIGDITGDAKPDLVARTSDGKLFRHSGNGNGTVAGRVQIGSSGWAGFKSLY